MNHFVNTLRHYHRSVKEIEDVSNIKRASAYGEHAKPQQTRERMERLLALFGNPHRHLKFVHVTGTSGKGSTTLMIGQMLQQSGQRTGIYLSPHTTTTIERFIGPESNLMSTSQFAHMAKLLQPILSQMDREAVGTPSYLEIMVAIALTYFKKTHCEWVSLEVGMGGARDATNVIPTPAVAVITAIGKDHAHLIGPTLSNITREKSGIIKTGTHVFTSELRPALRGIIQERCNEVHAVWHPELLNLPRQTQIAMEGLHQVQNARLAWTVGEYLRIPIPARIEAIRTTRLPCRWEVVQRHPTIILDGAHNPIAMQAIAERFDTIPTSRRLLMVALAESKEPTEALRALPRASELILTRFVSSRAAHSPGTLARLLRAKGWHRRYKKITTILDPDQALAMAQSRLRKNDILLVTGSLYLTGDLRKHWISEEVIIKNRSSFSSTTL